MACIPVFDFDAFSGFERMVVRYTSESPENIIYVIMVVEDFDRRFPFAPVFLIDIFCILLLNMSTIMEQVCAEVSGCMGAIDCSSESVSPQLGQ